MPGNKAPRKDKAKGKGGARPRGADKGKGTIELRVENVQITKVTVLVDGGTSSQYFTGGNVTLARAQQIINELFIETARKEAKAEAQAAIAAADKTEQNKNTVTGGPNDRTNKTRPS